MTVEGTRGSGAKRVGPLQAPSAEVCGARLQLRLLDFLQPHRALLRLRCAAICVDRLPLPERTTQGRVCGRPDR
jgi:hypothetical protein